MSESLSSQQADSGRRPTAVERALRVDLVPEAGTSLMPASHVGGNQIDTICSESSEQKRFKPPNHNILVHCF